MESSPKQYTNEEIAALEKTRTISDAELLKGGANYVINERGEKELVLNKNRDQAFSLSINEQLKIHNEFSNRVEMIIKESNIRKGDFVCVTLENGEDKFIVFEEFDTRGWIKAINPHTHNPHYFPSELDPERIFASKTVSIKNLDAKVHEGRPGKAFIFLWEMSSDSLEGVFNSLKRENLFSTISAHGMITANVLHRLKVKISSGIMEDDWLVSGFDKEKNVFVLKGMSGQGTKWETQEDLIKWNSR